MEIIFKIVSDTEIELKLQDTKFLYNIAEKSIDASRLVEFLSNHNEEIKSFMSSEENELYQKKSTEYKNVIEFLYEIIKIYNETRVEVYESSEDENIFLSKI